MLRATANDFIAPRYKIDGYGVFIYLKVSRIGNDGLGYRYFSGPKKKVPQSKFYSGVPLKRKEELKIGKSFKLKVIEKLLQLCRLFWKL